MTSNIEQGILAFLITKLTGADYDHGSGDNEITIKACTISTKTVGLYAMMSNGPVAEILPGIIVRCVEPRCDVETLWSCQLEIAVSTPRNVDAYTEALHRAICAAVRTHMVVANVADIATALAGYGITGCNKWFEAGAPDQHTDGRWITVHRYDPFAFTV